MAKKTVFRFFRDQFTTVPPVVHVDLKGKTVIVVGANTGLGFEAAQHFARMGAGRLIMACRSQARGEAALQRLTHATGYSNAELWLLDLADFASVRAFVDKALTELERLDILMLNAAYAPSGSGEYTETTDGRETTLQVNNLSGSLLALLLLPRMLDTAKQFNTIPRLVVVSSEVHYWAKLEPKVLESPNAFELIGNKEYCTPQIVRVRYLDSKLLNVFFTRALSDRLRDKPIIVNTVNPGLCHSELMRNNQNLFVTIFMKLFARTAEEGGRQLVWAAVGKPEGDVNSSLEKLRGGFVSLAQVIEPGDFVLGEQGKKWEDKLWADLLFILRKVDPRVGDVVTQHLQGMSNA